MAKAVERDLSRIGWLDYVLMSIGSCLAVYSAGMSIGQPSISYFCVVLVLVGTFVSYAVRVLTIKSVWIKFDALFYSTAVIAAIFFSTELRDMMPEGGFPREIAAAGWLCWMLILGSFATWQDSTLLFQAIPALALFGLIGCYDTYRGSTVAFFAFLLCLTTLFARAHGRQMLRQAANSGYFTRGLAPGTPIPSVDTTPGLARKLKEGPWRWVAGPEWALASALGVVILSLLGAPVIRQTVSGVAGFVSINAPTLRNRPNAGNFGGSDGIATNVRVGRAFVHSPTPDRLIVTAKLDRLRYLRTETYDRYTGKGWNNSSPESSSAYKEQDTALGLVFDEMRKSNATSRRFNWELETLRPMRMLPIPGEPTEVTADGYSVNLRKDGTYLLASQTVDGVHIEGTSVEPAADVRPTEAARPDQLRPLLSPDHIPARVVQLAMDVTKSSKNDYEKAISIQAEISKRILYNLDSPDTPGDKDPVEYALFDHQEGYCVVFASAMVLMARSVNIPARYVQGYLPDERRHAPGGAYNIVDADYHAWAELFFKDVGWVIFDPSVTAQAKDGEGVGDNGDQRPWYTKTPVLIAIDVLTLFGIGALLIFGSRYVKVYRRSLHQGDELQRVYIHFLRTIEKTTRKRRGIGETPDEFVREVGIGLASNFARAVELNERFIVASFGAPTVSVETVETLRAELKQFKLELRRTQVTQAKRTA